MRATRRLLQFGFLALTIAGVFILRGNAERWCPFGGVEAIYTYATEGNLVCSLGVSNFYILAAVLLMAVLLRRAFCGYMCPLGTIGEWLRGGARRLGLRPRRIPYALDRGLALLKYVVLSVILYFTWRAGELVFRGYDPCYALLSRHGEDITFWAYVISGVFVLASLVIIVPFCRWFCPLAAVFAPFSRFGLTRVKRVESSCVDCGVCARVCPMGIRVDKVYDVTASRCTSCLECVAACPKRDGGALHWGPPRWLGGRWPQAVLVGVMLLCVGAAVAAAYAIPLPSFVNTRGEQPAQTATARLEVHGLNCRGSASLFVYFLERDDEFEVPGYLRIEAWPGPAPATAHIIYDPVHTDEAAINEAITEPYYDAVGGVWRASPFEIVGYDPLSLTP